MQVVRNYGTSDAYNYGLLAGKLAGQMYENRERRGAYKDLQGFYANETANNLDTRNNNFKAAWDAYSANPNDDTLKRAQELGRGINPNIDFTQANWGDTTYQRGIDQANYYRNFGSSNEGKTVNGEGDNKFVDYSTYRANDPYSSTTSNPAAQRKNNVLVLNNGLPLNADVMDALTRYIVAQGGH